MPTSLLDELGMAAVTFALNDPTLAATEDAPEDAPALEPETPDEPLLVKRRGKRSEAK